MRMIKAVFLFILSLMCAGSAQAQYDYKAHREGSMNSLLVWSGGSAIAGTAMMFSESAYVRAFGMQNIAWGAIDAGIALAVKNNLIIAITGDAQKDKKALADLFFINFLIDFAYIGAGIWLCTMPQEDLRGHGAGIITQGAFLLVFDGFNWVVAAK
jgi:hypothetical protein